LRKNALQKNANNKHHVDASKHKHMSSDDADNNRVNRLDALYARAREKIRAAGGMIDNQTALNKVIAEDNQKIAEADQKIQAELEEMIAEFLKG
jgi:hypothetical protein